MDTNHEEARTMKTNRIVLFALVLGLALALSSPAQQSADELYKAGLYEEEVGGDLHKAIGIYQDLLKRFPASREAAAKAQLHIGLCYEKLGTTEAERAFQKVVDNYPEQSDAVREAREKLSLLSRSRAAAKTGAAEFSTRRIWSGPGVDTMGAVSPDGRYLSFVDWETGDLAVRDLATGTNRRLTDKGPWDKSPEFAMYSVWSRDGRRIAYQWYGKDDILEVRVYDIRDSSIRTIVRDKSIQDWAQASDWSPDGGTVLVAFWEAATPDQKERGRVGLVSLKDGSVRWLKGHFESLSAYNFGWGFSFSPDGKHIAYGAPRSYDESGNDDIFLISLDNGTEERLVDHPAFEKVVGWTPDGLGLLFSSDRTGSLDLYLLPLWGGKPQESPRLVKSGIGTITPLGITSRGDLYYGVGGGGTDIYIADVGANKGEGPVPVKKLALPHQGRNMYPDYAPEGDRLAFLSTPPGRGEILGLVSLKTGKVRELRLELPRYIGPRWIPPDGRSISVQGRDKDGLSVMYRVDVQTGAVSPIVSLDKGWVFFGRHAWAPNGQRVYYSCGLGSEKNRWIYAFDLKTGRSERLIDKALEPTAIAISPDGNWLALMNDQGRRSLRIMPISGGEPREIHGFEHPGGAVVTPAWSADGRSIYLPKLRDPGKNIWDLYRVPADGGSTEKIDLGLARVSLPSVSPGGREIAFQSMGTGPQPSEVWVMENFLPADKAKK
jgi:Tol biopolymer transport system component